MNILILNDFGHVNGGTAQVAVADAVALAQAGPAVTFFCAVGLVAPEPKRAGGRVICLGQQEIAADPNRLRAAKRGIWNHNAAMMLDRLLAEQLVPPIEHVHGLSKASSGSVCATALARCSIVVVSLHDYFAACPNGGFYQYPQQGSRTLAAMSASCIVCNCGSRSYAQKLYRVARQAVQRQVGRLPGRVRRFAHHSQLVRSNLAPYLRRDVQFKTVPMAVDTAPGRPALVQRNQGFAAVGRLSPEKSATLFAQAAVRAGIRPIFVGEGRERNAILAMVPDAEVTGWQTGAEVMQRLAKARALVSPALSYETFGQTVAEALAQRVPAIVADRSATAELVQDGETGLLFRTGDTASLASSLEILKDSGRAATMGRRAYEHYWQSPLSAERHLAAMLAVYERICA
jgi:glycosyltransferase involved in cell wall biosynthesis